MTEHVVFVLTATAWPSVCGLGAMALRQLLSSGVLQRSVNVGQSARFAAVAAPTVYDKMWVS